MAKESKTKQLAAKVYELENDNIALGQAVIALEGEMELLRKMLAEGYNPYNSNRPLIKAALKPEALKSDPVDNSIHINIKR